MKKTWKCALSVLCATTLVVGSIQGRFGQVVNATEASKTVTGTMRFGGRDTYLQLSKPLAQTPEAIEATVGMTKSPTEWTLFDVQDTVVIGGDGKYSTGTTSTGEAPGADVHYYQFDKGTTSVHTNNANLGIRQTQYGLNDLALSFWCYNGGSDGETLGTAGQIRLSSYSADKDKNMLYYVMNNASTLTLKKGWNYIELPLNTWGVPPTATTDAYGVFDVSNIQSFGFNGYSNTNGSERRFTDFKLIAVGEEKEAKEWKLRDGIGEVVTEISSVPDIANGPGTGATYYKVGANETINVATKLGLNINVKAYEASDLALGFWYYNGSQSTTTLATGNEQLRISNNESGLSSNFLYYVMKNISVDPGWDYIELPLTTWPEYENLKANFAVSNIKSFGIDCGTYKNSSNTECYFTDFELVALEEKTEWKLRGGIGDAVANSSSVPDYTNGPGKDATFYKVVAGTTVNVPTKFKLNIDASKYDPANLALSFWYYNGNQSTTTLATGNEQFRISNNESGLSSNFLYYVMKNISVDPGWNYIELPLTSWPEYENLKANFAVSNIKSFGIDCGTYTNGGSADCYFTDFELIVLDEWTLCDGVGEKVTNISGVPDTENGPGTDATYYKVPAGETVTVTPKINMNINTGSYGISDLVLGFWYYNGDENATTLATGNEQLRISSNADNLNGNALYYVMNDISVEQGWNYIELPLSKWPQWIMGNFSVSNIQTFGIDCGTYENNTNADCYFTDFVLEVPQSAEVQVEKGIDASALASNYMIFSNTNTTNEENSYALFITSQGYPALLWGNTQFTLTKNVSNGRKTKISVIRDEEGYINFYVNGEFVAKSRETVSNLGVPTTAHCIGADGAGNQIMNGSISNLKVYGDSKKANCIGNWILRGDIQHVTDTLPDSSGNGNDVVYRGTRADDWIDYETPAEIGDDYWSVVFIPDIQNLTNADDYNETWMTMAQWIADNVDAENIKHVIGAGDSTWNNTKEQYERAVKGFELFNKKVSWSNMVGNHDYDWSKTERDSSMYRAYFGEDAIRSTAASDTYKGYYNDLENKTTTENSYYRFSVNGMKWMVLQLEYHPRLGAIQWADEIIKAYPSDNVILTTHGYINGWGQYIGETMGYISSSETGYITKTDTIWNELKDNENIKLILNGHSINGTGAIVQKTEITDGGQEVPVLMINAQDSDAGEGYRDGDAYFTDKPLGMISILRFSADGKNMALQYYSPTEGKSFSPTDVWGNRNSNKINQVINAESCLEIVQEYTAYEAGTAPVDVPTGYVFSGWFKDDACTIPIEKKKWRLRDGVGTEVVDTGSVPDIKNGPGTDATYYKVSAGATVNVPTNLKLNIDASKYDPANLALSFWYYNGDESVTTLATGNEQLRISNAEGGLSSNFLYYLMKNISVVQGWNHIELPLTSWPEYATLKENFSISNIKSFGIDCATYTNSSSNADCYFTDFELSVLDKWTLLDGVGEKVTDVSTVPDIANGPGTDAIYYKVSAGETVTVTPKTSMGINTGSYGMDDLVLGFWYYNGDENATTLATGNEQLRISSNADNLNGNALYYVMKDIPVVQGWNYIKLPLSKWPQWIMGNFSVNNIQSFGIDCRTYANTSNADCYFTDFKLMRLTDEDDSKAYAKFVDAEVLSVKAQVRLDKVTDASGRVMGYQLPEGSTDMRFVTTVDSTNYRQVGFEITAKASDGTDRTITVGSQYVYGKLYAVGKVGTEDATPLPYTPAEEFSPLSKWFKTFTVKNIPVAKYDEEFKVRPYWITLDGTTVYGEQQTKTVNEGMPRTVDTIPQIAATSYETEDVVIADIIPTRMGYAVDPSGKKDSTYGIQKALDDCFNAGGGTVFLPAGNYVITETINIPSYVTLRGDYQDPDGKLEGEKLECGTIISVKTDSVDSTSSGIVTLNGSSGVVGLTVYYPNQTLEKVLPYPYTFYIASGAYTNMVTTIKDITVINGYRGIGTQYDMHHECLNVENFKGTFLDTGLALHNQSDVGRVDNVTVSSKYWALASENYMKSAAQDAVETYMKANTVGVLTSCLEWTTFSRISVEDCSVGIQFIKGAREDLNSVSMIDVNIVDCNRGLVVDENALDSRWGSVIARSSIEGNITNNSNGVIRVTNGLTEYNVNYSASYTKPVSRVFVAEMDKGITTDVSGKLQELLTQAGNAGGGIVYVPGGTYRFDNPVQIPAGVELRGTSAVASREQWENGIGTIFLCYYGDDATYDAEKDAAFITLSGKNSGVNGLRIIYPENGPYDDDLNTTYTIRGKASGVYANNIFIMASANGIDFKDCDNHFIKGVYSCCWKNTFRLGGKNGVIRDCLHNGNMVVRTNANGLPENWPTEEELLTAVTDSIIRKTAQYIITDGANNEQVQGVFAYAVHNFLINQNSVATMAINVGTDNIADEGVQFTQNSGSMTVINAMRCKGKSYEYVSGKLELFNRICIDNIEEQNETIGE